MKKENTDQNYSAVDQKANDAKVKTSKKENKQAKQSAEDLKSEYEEKLQEEKDKFLRLYAEFENYKRRTSKERLELFKTAGQDVLSSLIPVLDDFDRAINELTKTDETAALQGVTLIQNKFKEILKSKGLEVSAVANGDAFDADFHEAVTQIPAPTPEMKGKIVDVLEKGYKLGDKIIRYPKVVIGQ
ncbi:MAG: nucleotide exchange factor GrpE [Bacteroidetes bacterium]|nr:nucleotide exchange factor GrpE [Bacteroidota bacterium]